MHSSVDTSMAVQTAFHTLLTRVNDLESDNADLEDQLEALEAQSLLSKDSSLSERLSRNSDSENRIRTLKFAIEQMEIEKSALQRKAEVTQTLVEGLLSQIASLQTKTTPQVTEIDSNLATLEENEAKTEAFGAFLKEKSLQLDEEIDKLQEIGFELRDNLQTRKTEITSVKLAFDRLTETVKNEMESKNRVDSERISSISGTFDELERENEVLKLRNEHLDSQLEDIMSEIDAIKQPNVVRRTDLRIPESENRGGDLEREIRELYRQVQKRLGEVQSPSQAEGSKVEVREITEKIEEKMRELERRKRGKQAAIRTQVVESL